MPFVPIQLPGQVLGLFENIVLFGSPEVLSEMGAVWDPQAQRPEETFLGLSKVLVGEPWEGPVYCQLT